MIAKLFAAMKGQEQFNGDLRDDICRAITSHRLPLYACYITGLTEDVVLPIANDIMAVIAKHQTKGTGDL